MDVLLWEQNQDHKSETSCTQSHANKCFSAGADRRMHVSHMHVAPLRRFATAHTPEHQTPRCSRESIPTAVFPIFSRMLLCVKPVDEREAVTLQAPPSTCEPPARSGLVKKYVKQAVNKQVSSASGHAAPRVTVNGLPEQCSMRKSGVKTSKPAGPVRRQLDHLICIHLSSSVTPPHPHPPPKPTFCLRSAKTHPVTTTLNRSRDLCDSERGGSSQ